MKRNALALLLALCMVLVLLSGCGGQNASQGSAPAAAASAGSEAETAAETVAEEPETAEEPAEEAGSAEAEPAEEPAEEALDYRDPLTYPIADGDVTFTILHNEPALGPMTGQMNMSTYGDFETIALGTETIGVTPEWSALSAWSGDTQFNLIVASGDYPDVFSGIDKYYTGSFPKALEDEVIVKLVNFSPDPEDVQITLDCPVEDGYTLAYLAGDGDAMNDENDPENVHDEIEACTGASQDFVFHARANSANVLILKKK